MPHKKILFLDIDGVVLPERANYLPNQTKPVMKVFDPCAVALLNEACHRRRWKIVIHSSWLRYAPTIGDVTVLRHCIEQGIKVGFFHEDAMCDGNLHWRYDRVDEWLSRHSEISHYYILDDTRPDVAYPRVKHWIECDANEGITMDVFDTLATKELSNAKCV